MCLHLEKRQVAHHFWKIWTRIKGKLRWKMRSFDTASYFYEHLLQVITWLALLCQRSCLVALTFGCTIQVQKQLFDEMYKLLDIKMSHLHLAEVITEVCLLVESCFVMVYCSICLSRCSLESQSYALKYKKGMLREYFSSWLIQKIVLCKHNSCYRFKPWQRFGLIWFNTNMWSNCNILSVLLVML